MIEVVITKDQVDRAEKMTEEISNLKNSVTKGKSAIFGTLGEVIVSDYFKDKALVEDVNTYNFDMKINGKKIEVKSKKTTVVPREHYTCTVFGYNTTQKCDYYVFARIREDFSKGYILGYLAKKEFYSVATKRMRGVDYDGIKTPADCYNITISQLKKFKSK